MPTKKTRYPTALIRGTLRGRSTTSATTTRYPGPAPRPTSLLAVAGRHGSAAARAAPSVSRGSGASVSTRRRAHGASRPSQLERLQAGVATHLPARLLMPGPSVPRLPTCRRALSHLPRTSVANQIALTAFSVMPWRTSVTSGATPFAPGIEPRGFASLVPADAKVAAASGSCRGQRETPVILALASA